MPVSHRRLIALSAAWAAGALPPGAVAALWGLLGIDANEFGVRAASPDDQSRSLQAAIDRAAAARAPLMLGPDVYRAGDLKLRPGAQLVGVRGATRLLLNRAAPSYRAMLTR